MIYKNDHKKMLVNALIVPLKLIKRISAKVWCQKINMIDENNRILQELNNSWCKGSRHKKSEKL